jgi:hypothetical protein
MRFVIRRPRGAQLWTVVTSGLFAALCLAWAIYSVLSSGYATTAVALGLTVWWSIPVVGALTMPTAIAEVSHDSDGTTLRPDRRLERVGQLMLIVGIPVAAAFGILALRGDLVVPGPQDPAGVGPTLIRNYGYAFGICTFVLLIYWWRMRRNGGMGRVRLTVDGFEFLDGLQSAEGHWSEVTAVTNDLPDLVHARTPLGIVMGDGRKAVIRSSSMYAGPDGRALYELVRYYWQHPDSRVELTNDGAIDRFHTTQRLCISEK